MASASTTDYGSSGTKTTSDMYSLNDGAPSVEIDRLDEQHRVLLRPMFGNSLLPLHVTSYLHQAAKERPVAVADIATGTSIWLRELAQELPANSRLDGFDMDTSKYLAPSKLPGNVKLHEQDFFQPFPQECEGVYDVVHVRLIWLVVRADQWTPLAQALKKLLRPGGWLVFTEGVIPCCETFPPDMAFQWWQMYLAELDQRKRRDPMSGLHLIKYVGAAGLQNTQQQYFHSLSLGDADIGKYGAECFMPVVGLVLRSMVRDGGYQGLEKVQDADDIVNAVLAKSRKGELQLDYHMVWVSGQKPLQ